MAQTGTSVVTVDSPEGSSIRVVKIVWTATAGGAVATDFNDTAMSGYQHLWGNGWIIQVGFVSGVTTPTNLYDVTLVDARGLELMGGAGADVTSAAALARVTNFSTISPGYIAGKFNLVVAAAGAAGQGTTYIYIR